VATLRSAPIRLNHILERASARADSEMYYCCYGIRCARPRAAVAVRRPLRRVRAEASANTLPLFDFGYRNGSR
jgi:hypothetical protein